MPWLGGQGAESAEEVECNVEQSLKDTSGRVKKYEEVGDAVHRMMNGANCIWR